MIEHFVTLVGLQIADPGIAWPSPDRGLSEREGWERCVVCVATVPPIEVEAMCRGQMAVHQMIDSEGFSLTCLPSGLRLHSRGRVFARSAAAMVMAEKAMELYDDWENHVTMRRSAPREIGEEFARFHDEAERHGEVLKDIVVPKH